MCVFPLYLYPLNLNQEEEERKPRKMTTTRKQEKVSHEEQHEDESIMIRKLFICKNLFTLDIYPSTSL